MKNIRRLGPLFPLITNPKLLGVETAEVGHVQVALTFVNKRLTPSKLMKYRDEKDEDATYFPDLDTHLVLRVCRFSKTFEQHLREAIENDDAMRKAREPFHHTKEALANLRAANEAHFGQIRGYEQLAREYDKIKSQIRDLKKEGAQRGFLRSLEKKLLAEYEKNCTRIGDEIQSLKKSNPSPFGDDLKRLKRDLEAARQAMDATEGRLWRSTNYRKPLLVAFLEKRGFDCARMPSKLFDGILHGRIELYELEKRGHLMPTDRRGIPLCTREFPERDDAGEMRMVTKTMSCLNEIVIPWSYVLTGISPEHWNQPYSPATTEGPRYVVYAPVDQDSTVDIVNVGNIMVGQLPSFDDDGKEAGRLVIIRKKQWAEITRTIDIIREHPTLIGTFLEFYPPADEGEVLPAKPDAPAPAAKEENTAEKPVNVAASAATDPN